MDKARRESRTVISYAGKIVFSSMDNAHKAINTVQQIYGAVEGVRRVHGAKPFPTCHLSFDEKKGDGVCTGRKPFT